MSHETRTKPPTYPEILDIHDGAFSESIWGSDGFRTIKVSGQSDVVADSYKDNLTIAAGSNITLTTNAAGDTLTIAATGGTYTAGTGLQLSGNQFSVTSLAVTNVHEAANQTAQLALTTQEGDIVVRTDENKSYVKNSGTAGSMSDWTLLRTPTDVVQSVAGNTGAVTANQIAAAVESASDSNTFTDADHAKLNAIEPSATADQTNAEIRAAVEAASDSNVFTDDDHSKLNAIEPNATADQTNEEIQDIVGGMVSGNTETGITVTYEDSDGTLDFVVASQTANDFTNTLKSKLDGIEPSADVTDATNVDAAGAVMNADVDAKGDLLVGSADNTVTRLAVGTNGYILKADSSTGTGLAWGAAGSGGDPNQNAFSTVAVSGQDNVAADTTTDTLNLAAGSNVTLTTNASSDTVTIAASNTNAAYMEKAGGTFTGDVKLNNNEELRFGTGTDLIIVHDGTNATIKETTGNLDIRAKNTNGGLVTISDSAGENLIKATAGSKVELTYDGTTKFETTSAGATVTGTLTADLADNSIDSEHYVDGSIDTAHLANLAVTGAKIANMTIDTAQITNNAITTDRIADGNITADKLANDSVTNAKVADDAIGIAELSATGTASSSTYLRGDNTWQTISAGGLSNIVEDTSPQLGGDLDTNSFEIKLDDFHSVKFGDDDDLKIYHDGSHAYLDNKTGDIHLRVGSSGDTNGLLIENGGPTFFYHSGSYKAKTVSGGFLINGTLDVGTITSTGGLSMDNPTNAGKDWSWNHGSNQIELLDGVKIAFGNSGDLKIEHDGANSSITEAGTGKFILKSDSQIELVSSTNESMIEAIVDGEVKLYHNGVYKAKTVSGGFTVDGTCTATAFSGDGSSLTNITATDSTKLPLAGGTLTGDVRYNDNVKAEFGSSGDMLIYHDGSTGSFIKEDSPTGHLNIGGSQVIIQNADMNETCAKFITDGAVELYHNNVKKVETTADGIKLKTSGMIQDAQYIRNDTVIYFQKNDGSVKYAQMTENTSVDLYYDNVKRFETTSTGAKVTGAGTAGLRNVHTSTSAPGGSDGADGDLWIKY